MVKINGVNGNSFYGSLALIGDPFYTKPVGYDEKDLKDFINMSEELKKLERFMEKRDGSIVVIGDIGVGKSSLLKRSNYIARKNKRTVFEIDVKKNPDVASFFCALLDHINYSISKDKLDLPKEEIEKLKEKLSILQVGDEKVIDSLEKKKGHNLEGNIQVVKGGKNFESAESQQTEKVFYKNTWMDRIRRFFREVGDCLDKFSVVLIADNLDKLDDTLFKEFLSDVVKLMPSNILFLTTANTLHMRDSEIIKDVKQVFHTNIYLKPIKDTTDLQKFVEGRLKNYSVEGKVRILFCNPIYEALLEVSDGNLRSCFQYLSRFLIRSDPKKIIDTPIKDKNEIIYAIKEEDEFMFSNIGDGDFHLLELLYTFNNSEIRFLFEKYTQLKTKLLPDLNVKGENILRRRYEALFQAGWITKDKIPPLGKGNRKTVYRISEIKSDILSLNKLELLEGQTKQEGT